MSVKRWIKAILAIGLFATAGISQANVQADLDSFFKRMGAGGANVSTGAVVKGQSAGYLVGGSLYVRTPVRTLNLISVTVPSISAGCGGIDAYLGAFSFVNSEQLQAMSKAIMSNAIGYAFNLALETVCPQCKAVMNDLQDMVNKVNMNNMTTCQAAQGLVNGIASRTWLRDNDMCLKLATEGNYFSDWSAAARGCSNSGGRTDGILNDASNDPKKQNRVARNINITWSAFNDIKQVITDDRELKEIMMTMIGTTIYGNKSGDFQSLPTLGVNNELINTLMYGGSVQIYRCNETTKCLKPTISKINISKDQSMVSKITKLMNKVFDRMKLGEAYSQAEQNFISTLSTPVLRSMRETAMAGIGDSLIVQLADQIAFQYTMYYLESLNDLATRANMGSISEKDQMDADRFRKALSDVKMSLRNEMAKVKFNDDAYSKALQFRQGITPILSIQVLQNIQED